jgi:hypothetical protein
MQPLASFPAVSWRGWLLPGPVPPRFVLHTAVTPPVWRGRPPCVLRGRRGFPPSAYVLRTALRGQGHSFSYSHRLPPAWQKGVLTGWPHRQCQTSYGAACGQASQAIAAVLRSGKTSKTLTVLPASVRYQPMLSSSSSWWDASSSLSLRRSDHVPPCTPPVAPAVAPRA